MRGELRELVDRSALPPPGGGCTWNRFHALAEASRRSVGVGRLFEAHADAEAILLEAGRSSVGDLGLLGAWASDRNSDLRVVEDGSELRLVGQKPFCSGAPLLDHAVVTARSAVGVELCLVDLNDPGVCVERSHWTGLGMRSTETRVVRFEGARCSTVGPTGWYLARPGFWHGAVAVAASWYGGAVGLLDAMVERVDADDLHQLAHLGEAEALRWSMEAALQRGAREIDERSGVDHSVAARARALRIRRVVADGCLQIVAHAGDSLGPRALAFDASFSQRIADLEIYVRQDHGRRDSEQLGRSVLEQGRLPC